MIEAWLGRPHIITFIIVFLWGLYLMVAHHNLIRKLIGMYLVQTSIIFLFVTLGVKVGSTVPILHSQAAAINPADYANPLPQMLMLTAIVVGVSTLGVALAIVVAIYREYQTIDEDEILRKIE
jgi:multicomponent Na+:H+ antiporter subunit C